jgi:hypothetical protein
MANQDARAPAPPPDTESLHLGAIGAEYQDPQARGLLQCARNLGSIEITTGGGGERYTAAELSSEHPRLLIVGAQGSGKSALVADLAMRASGRPGEPSPDDRVPFVVPVELRRPGERLDEALLARLSPAAGPALVARALAERRAVVIVDGLDAAHDGPSLLIESIPAFAKAHPGNRFVVTTRPLRTGIAGQRRVELPGFVTAFMLPPLDASRVYSAYRFLGRRTPQRKATLYLEEVDSLLRAWEPEALPPGSWLGRIGQRSQRALFASVAMAMHDDRRFEISAAALAAEIGAGLRVLGADGGDAETSGRADEIAPRIVEEIAQHPGLLVERRPGHFVFAEFALQEILTAVEWAEDGCDTSWFHDDRWWHGVIELAAGLPGVDAAGIVRDLLDSDNSARPMARVLAARCAEAAPDLPDRTRRALEKRISDLVPPEHCMAAERLVQAGDLAAPLLLRALPRFRPVERALAALVFGRLRHEPACGALVTLASDTARARDVGSWPICGSELGPRDQPVATFALAALFELARVSRIGRSAFTRALARAPLDSIELLRFHVRRTMSDMAWGDTEPERDQDLIVELVAQMESVHARRAGREAPKRPR